MDTHVKVLGVLYLAFSALSLLIALFLMLAIGSAAGIVGMTADSGDAAVAIPVLGIAGTALGMMLLVLALPGLITGWGLLNYKPWARILGIVLSVINLLNIPFGTALGIYGLWVLLNKDTERLFTSAATLPTPS
jgi:hypothetical protein